uniref:non-specific serine/threonine protein kinase n=1 Tax=Brachypodium distachyon TaxID=15368 RepID=C3SAA9_BRADI|nr:CBL interacting serine/threonine kinase [Brachypodium distachyon]
MAGAARKKLVGRYEVGRTIGQGAFAKVKFAVDSDTGAAVAMKVLDKATILNHRMMHQVGSAGAGGIYLRNNVGHTENSIYTTENLISSRYIFLTEKAGVCRSLKMKKLIFTRKRLEKEGQGEQLPQITKTCYTLSPLKHNQANLISPQKCLEILLSFGSNFLLFLGPAVEISAVTLFPHIPKIVDEQSVDMPPMNMSGLCYVHIPPILNRIRSINSRAVRILLRSIDQEKNLHFCSAQALQIFSTEIKREISIMKIVRHPNIVRLNEVLAGQTKIYIILELITGGELFDKIARQGKLRENESRKYFQQLIDAIDYCHSKGVYHRDLKPENLLLDSHGNLKVTDFGLSTLSQNICLLIFQCADFGFLFLGGFQGFLHTTCGTPNYVAPEVLSKDGYDGSAADVWSCGVILYVLMAGYLPFEENDLPTLYDKITAAHFSCPDWFSSGAKSLIQRILDPNPKTRMTVEGIRADAWFKNNYVAHKRGEDENVCLDDVQAVFDNIEDKYVSEQVTHNDGGPLIMNAFEMITLSQGLDLSSLFDRQQICQDAVMNTSMKKGLLKSSLACAILGTSPVELSHLMPILSQHQEYVKRQTRFVSRKPARTIAATIQVVADSMGIKVHSYNYKIFEVAPSLFMVDVRKVAGDTLEYHRFYKNLCSKLESIIWRPIENFVALFWKKEFVFIRRTVASCHLSLRQGVAVPFVEISPTSPVEANTTRFINERRGPDAHTPQDEVSGPNQPWKVPGPSCAAMRPRKRGRPTSWLSLLRPYYLADQHRKVQLNLASSPPTEKFKPRRNCGMRKQSTGLYSRKRQGSGEEIQPQKARASETLAKARSPRISGNRYRYCIKQPSTGDDTTHVRAHAQRLQAVPQTEREWNWNSHTHRKRRGQLDIQEPEQSIYYEGRTLPNRTCYEPSSIDVHNYGTRSTGKEDTDNI